MEKEHVLEQEFEKGSKTQNNPCDKYHKAMEKFNMKEYKEAHEKEHRKIKITKSRRH